MFGGDNDSAKLEWNPGSGATSYRKWTFSCWVKRTKLGETQIIFGSYSGSGNNDQDYNILYFGSDDTLRFGAYTYDFLKTNRVFRDTSGWYHIMLVVNTFEATNYTDRKKLYVNGVQETSFATNNLISQNYNLGVLRGNPHYLGWTNGTMYYHGYMAEVYLLDNTPLTPSSFGETDSVTGQWVPIEYTGTFPGESTYLKFVSGAIGTDSSGNSNTWTASNLANSDVMLDSPTNNYCTLNGVATGGSIFSQGNLKATTGTNTNRIAVGTISTPSSGKWYWECTPTSLTGGLGIGVGNLGSYQTTVNTYLGNYAGTYLWYAYGGNGWKDVNGSNSSVGQSFVANDVVGIALDLDAGTLTMYKNGSSQLQVASGLSGQFEPVFSDGSGQYASAFEVNFGQKPFTHTPPNNHLVLNTSNLPTPTIKKPTDHFNTVLYTGNDTTNNITGVGFQPDLVFLKNRSQAADYMLHDAVRGADNGIRSNDNVAESDQSANFTGFASDGFSLDSSSNRYNDNSENYVAWNWKANGSGSANTDGSINSTVSANTTAGFSIVTFTGTSGTGTIGHGLSQAPETIWHKNRDATASWTIYHAGVASDPETDYLQFNSANAASDNSTVWNDTAPTSSVFTVGQGSMTNGDDSVAYCFHSVEGFSKFGSYIGDGTSDNGPFIHTGFKPRLVIVKKSSAAGSSWFMWDSLRHPENVIDLAVWVDATNGDTSHAEYEIDFLSNGFKIRGQNAGSNASGETHIYMAWAESPFKYANAR